MNAYIQRLLARADPSDANVQAATGEPVARAVSIAPVLSPLTEVDQRLQVPELDGDLLTAMLFADSDFDMDLDAADLAPMASPAEPARARREVGETATTASASLPAQVPVELQLSAASSAVSTAGERGARKEAPGMAQETPPTPILSEPRSKSSARAVPVQRPQRFLDARPVPEGELEPDSASLPRESIAQRDKGDVGSGYLVVRHSGVSVRVVANKVTHQPSAESTSGGVSRAQPQLVVPTTPEPSQTLENNPLPTRAEPAERLRPALEPALPPGALEPPPHQSPTKRSEAPQPSAPRPRNEVPSPSALEEAMPYRSAAAASVIGALPQRASSMLIRGWRRR